MKDFFFLLSHRDSLRISVLQVANTKRETVFKWLKDDVLYETETPPDLEKGVCELLIPKVLRQPWKQNSALHSL